MRHGALVLLGMLACLPQLRAAELAIVDVYFEDYDRRVVRQQVLPTGESIYLTFRIAGFRADDQRRIHLTYWLDCLDPQQVPITETFTKSIDTTLAPQDEKWRPKIDWSLVIPSFAPSGEYQVIIRVRDEIDKKEARQAMSFRVQGASIQPSSTLAIRDFEFSDAENGKPKPQPVFTPGTTLWARFRVVGFKISPEKELSIEEDLSVLDTEGKVLFSRPNAAVEKYKMFYPPRFLPASFNLDLDPKVKPGEYVIRLEVRDLLGKEEARHEAKFTVQ